MTTTTSHPVLYHSGENHLADSGKSLLHSPTKPSDGPINPAALHDALQSLFRLSSVSQQMQHLRSLRESIFQQSTTVGVSYAYGEGEVYEEEEAGEDEAEFMEEFDGDSTLREQLATGIQRTHSEFFNYFESCNDENLALFSLR